MRLKKNHSVPPSRKDLDTPVLCATLRQGHADLCIVQVCLHFSICAATDRQNATSSLVTSLQMSPYTPILRGVPPVAPAAGRSAPESGAQAPNHARLPQPARMWHRRRCPTTHLHSPRHPRSPPTWTLTCQHLPISPSRKRELALCRCRQEPRIRSLCQVLHTPCGHHCRWRLTLRRHHLLR